MPAFQGTLSPGLKQPTRCSSWVAVIQVYILPVEVRCKIDLIASEIPAATVHDISFGLWISIFVEDVRYSAYAPVSHQPISTQLQWEVAPSCVKLKASFAALFLINTPASVKSLIGYCWAEFKYIVQGATRKARL